MRLRPGWRSFTCLCLLVGALFRFAWVGDVEYKDDEDQLFRYSQAIPVAHLWPAIGTTSGVREIRHPALGIWSFAILAEALHLHTPLALSRGVQALSLTALALLFWFAARRVPRPQREIWLWTAALASVTLTATVYARKIWIPDLVPIFSVILLIAWSRRHTSAGALVWGIAGALVGQVHMTGFFYSAALLLGTVLFARTNVRWRAWLAGSAWGLIPALPWLRYVWSDQPALYASVAALPRTSLNLDFFRMAFEISLGQTAEFNLGGHFQEYLGYPLVFGIPTHGVHVARMLLHVIGAIVLLVAAAAGLQALARSAARRPFSDTNLCLLNLALTGVLFSIAAVPNLPHHHLMLFPLEYLWTPIAAVTFLPKARIWLTAVWLGSAVCTLGFLQFVHQHCGAPNGEYGIAYRCQEHETATTLAGRPGEIRPLIRPGQEEVIAHMLGRGELLPGSCRLVAGQIDGARVTGTYSCPEGRVGVRLDHPSRAPDDATRTRDFAVVLVAGSPPSGFLDALAERVRRDEPSFQWLLEAPPESVREPGLEPNGYYLPVLTSRQLLRRMVGGAVILVLASPWWAKR
ncbi:MAG TPA: hypothetical protein VKU61_08875 [Candidatus Binatia bacterium]|nr:hypothetical protein [Candidatus Binatia bacterium]